MKGTEMEYFTALYEVAKVINASLDPDRVLQEIVRCIVAAMHVKASSLRLLDSRERRLALRASYGLSEKYLRKGPILLEESGVDQKALNGETICLRDVTTDRDFQYGAVAAEEGIKSVLVVPLTLEQKAIGVLRVYTESARDFSEQEVKFLQAAANLSAIALDNARMHQTLQTQCDLMKAHKYRIDDN
jgi:signal transduction protein with GAF and PtsI domain